MLDLGSGDVAKAPYGQAANVRTAREKVRTVGTAIRDVLAADHRLGGGEPVTAAELLIPVTEMDGGTR